jgi:hypothetical protein
MNERLTIATEQKLNTLAAAVDVWWQEYGYCIPFADDFSQLRHPARVVCILQKGDSVAEVL